MCNWEEKAKAQYHRLKNYIIEKVFPSFVNQLPPGIVKPYHCLACGEPLTHGEMYPAGHPPRYMHQSCYEQLAYNFAEGICLTCGGQLPDHKINVRLLNPRELKNALHDGPCEEYHSVLAGIVFGLPFKTSAAKSETPLPMNKNRPALPLPKKPVVALPFPGLSSLPIKASNLFHDDFTFDSINSNDSNPVMKIKYLKFRE